jgi:hypothetical protein
VIAFITDGLACIPLQIFVLKGLVMSACKSQLKRIYYVLNHLSTVRLPESRKEVDSKEDMRKIRREREEWTSLAVKHLSGTLRTARNPYNADIPAAQLLREVTDDDEYECRKLRSGALGPIVVLLLSIPAAFALLGELAGNFGLGLFFPILWTSYSIANSLLIQISITALVLIYVVFLLYVAYKKGVFETAVYPLLKKFSPANTFSLKPKQNAHQISTRVTSSSLSSTFTRPHRSTLCGKL